MSEELSQSAPAPSSKFDGLPAIAPDFVEQDMPETTDEAVPTRGYHLRPMIGLGGSAGCIPVLQKFFAQMPADSGASFVVILHLSAAFDSTIAQILQRSTAMPVKQAEDGVKVKPNCVYVIPPGKHLVAVDGHLRLADLAPTHGKRVAVDLFFRSLADTYGPHAAAVILSGADGDGALGIKRTKERGGLTIAQDPEEAEHPSMPRTSIETGMVDWVLPVERIPEHLVRYFAQESRLRLPPEDGENPAELPEKPADVSEAALRDVLNFLRTRTGRDFSYYKRATILRRIARRLQVNGVDDLVTYLDFLRTHPGEAGALLQDLLISVTNFFRDRDAFAALEARIPELFAGKTQADALRVWVPACATGEEAYSIAMLLSEHARNLDSPPNIQVFATDLDDSVIHAARDGLYPFTIEADVSEERLRRFFTKEHRGYRVRRDLRETVLFAVHDLLKDSPFSRLDLISCRNLLIYLNRTAQARAFDIFHFALRPGGRLFLGSSESLDDTNAHFAVLDKKHRIYGQVSFSRSVPPVPSGPGTIARVMEMQDRARETVAIARAALAGGPGGPGVPIVPERHLPRDQVHGSWGDLHFELLERLAPPSVIVNANYDILHLSKSAGQFLQFAGGEPSMNLLHAVQPSLRTELRAALFRAAQSREPVEIGDVPVEIGGQQKAVTIRAVPAADMAADLFLVILDAREATAATPAIGKITPEQETVVRHLERELEQLKGNLRDTVEQYEASTEELKASNEELQAMNEELRSATEELETSREELQSINEELTTVNAELKHKVEELGHANSDLHNLMGATEIATIFLDRELHIMRFTPPAMAIFRLLPGDVGRPLSDLTHRLEYADLSEDARHVLDRLTPLEREIEDKGGSCFLARFLPYRTTDDHIAGVVLTFIDISERKRADAALRASDERFRAIVSQATVAIGYSDLEGRITFANERLAQLLQRPVKELIGRTIWEPVPGAPKGESGEVFQRAISSSAPFQMETQLIRRDGAPIWVHATVSPIRDANDEIQSTVAVIVDISERKEAEQALHESEARLASIFSQAAVGLSEISLAGRFERVNAELSRMLGRPSEELIGRTVAEVTHPEDVPLVAAAFELLLKTGQPQTLDKRCLRPDGVAVWSSSSLTRLEDPESKAMRLLAVTVDLTERRQAEAALVESEERLRLIVENAREYAIFAMDLQRRVTTWNVGAERLLGFTEPEILGQTADVIFTEEDRAAGAPEQEASTALATGKAADERWHLRKDRSRFWGSGVMMAMHGAADEVIGFVKIFRDQTAAREAREALEQSRQELWEALQENEAARAEVEAAGKAKDHFLAVLSHELRTPLTPVLMAVHGLRRRRDLPADVKDVAEMIRRNIQIEAQFIDDLLDVTRISRGKLEITRHPVDFHTIVRHAVEIASPDIEERHQLLTVSLEAGERRVIGDSTRLQQLVWNLLKNASKFTPEKGRIAVRTWEKPGKIFLEVADTGIGIEPEAIGRIFDSFAQASEAISQRFGGLGLGLAIAKATADAHGGVLRAASAGVGKGATFTLELPLPKELGA